MNGKIYDLDAPGKKVLFGITTPNQIWRFRVNFREWAEFILPGSDPEEDSIVRCSAKKPWYSRQSYKRGPASSSQFKAASAGGDTTVTVNDAAWTVDEWTDGLVKILTEPGAGQIRAIASNTADTITVTSPWTAGATPGADSVIALEKQTGWAPLDNVPGDNKNGDGSTNVSWNLQ